MNYLASYKPKIGASGQPAEGANYKPMGEGSGGYLSNYKPSTNGYKHPGKNRYSGGGQGLKCQWKFDSPCDGSCGARCQKR